MHIYINDVKFNVEEYDNEDSILYRYALFNDTLPEYLNLTPKVFKIKEETRIVINNIQHELKGVELPEVIKNINRYKENYSELSKSQIVIIWLLINIGLIPDLELVLIELIPQLIQIDRIKFINPRVITEVMKEQNTDIKKKKRDLKSLIDRQKYITKEIKIIKGIKFDKFTLEKITTLYSLDISEKITLEEIFDNINVSQDIPFVFLYHKGKEWYKIHKQSDISKKWINFEIPQQKRGKKLDGIYFRILNTPYNKLTKRNLNVYYSKGVWLKNNNIEIESHVQAKMESDKIKDKLLDSLNDRIVYKIRSREQLNIKGHYNINNINVNRAIFSYLVDNNLFFNYFLFFDEITKTVLNKKPFYVKYQPNQMGDEKSLRILITQKIDKDDNWINIRVSKGKNIDQIKSFQIIFSKILSMYLTEYKNVYELHEKLLGGSVAKDLINKYTKEYIPKKKEDEKSKKRLLDLKTKRPEIFTKDYASVCQPSAAQPYILDSNKVDNFIEEYGKHAVLKYTDPFTDKIDYYACQPREKNEPNKWIWPGLRKNDKMENKKQVPYVPCCFETNQYLKKAGINKIEKYNKFIQKEQITKANIYKDLFFEGIYKDTKKDPILPGRYGSIPYYLSVIVRNIKDKEGNYVYKIDKKTHRKQEFLPILRYGVLHRPDSFVHCMARVFEEDYMKLTNNKKIDLVLRIRKKISKMDFSIAKQELFDYTDKEIKDILLDSHAYLDPGVWISLIEEFYNCNIFIYELDKEVSPNGKIVIPHHTKAYLYRDIHQKNERNNVFIIKKRCEKCTYPYQCELIVELYKENKKILFNYHFLNDDYLVKEANRLIKNSNRIYILENGKSQEYKI